MPIDPSIPLQAKPPEQQNALAMLMQGQQYKYLQQNNNRLQMDTAANQAASQAIQANTGNDGAVNQAGVRSQLANDPNAGYNLQAATGTTLDQQGKQIGNDTNQFALHNAYTNTALQTASGLLQDKRINAPAGQYDPEQASQALSEGVNQMLAKGVPMNQALVAVAPYVNAIHTPGAVANMLQNTIRGQIPATSQQELAMPSQGSVSTGGGTTFINRDKTTGAVTPTGTIDNTLSPDAAANQVNVTNDQGQPALVPIAKVLQGQGMGGVLPPQAVPQGQQPVGAGRYPSSPQQGNGTFTTGPAAGVVDATKKANAAGGDELVADQQSNADSGTRINMLNSAQAALSNAQTGIGADKINAVRGLAATLGLGDAAKTASFDEVNKYLTQYAQQKAASFGRSTDAQLSAALSSNGSTHISNLAAQDVVTANLGLERMEQARMKAWQSSGLPANQYTNWKSQFGATMDPRVFIVDQMNPAKAQAMIKSMKPAEQNQFKQQYNWAVSNNYINGPQ